MIDKLHFGPGSNWIKPDSTWGSIDADSARADIVVDFNKFKTLEFSDQTILCIYGSHIFEHINIFNAPKVFKECYRVLVFGGILRIVLPDVRKSIENYIKGNRDYVLFKRREELLKSIMGYEKISLFELLKSDFISPTGQHEILGQESLAHQNAWDYEAICLDLCRAGFDKNKIVQSEFQQSSSSYFSFEGTYPSEANEYERSLYIEAI